MILIGLLTTMMLTHALLSPPSIVAGEVATMAAPNAQAWRQQSESLAEQLTEQREINERLHAEIKRLKASQWRDFTATAYTADCPEGCSGITKTGLDVRNRTHVNGYRVAATDPRIIPMNTKFRMLIDGELYDNFIALDVGGAITGTKIDVLVADTNSAINFGRRSVKVEIIKWGDLEGS